MYTTYYDYTIKAFVPFYGQDVENGFVAIGRIYDTDRAIIKQGKIFKAFTDAEREAFWKQNTGGGLGVSTDGYSPVWLEKSMPTSEQLIEQYENKVNELIRTKYTLSQELAILRQKDEKPEEYTEYYAYCEQCKSQAKIEVYGEQS